MSLGIIAKRVAMGLAAVVILLLVVSLFLPSRILVERQIVIEAPPAEVFPLVNNYPNTVKWSPWLSIDPLTKIQFDGPAEGVGARMSWHSEHPDVGVGSGEIVASEKDRLVRVSLVFEGHGGGSAYFLIAPDVSGSALKWGFETNAGWNPVARYFGLLMDGFIGPYYEKGLANIKKLAESNNR